MESFERNLDEARHGDAEAQYKVGCALAQGRGTKKDEVAARAWLIQSAQRNYARAFLSLSGMETNRQAGFQYALKGAALGDRSSAFSVGSAYDTGHVQKTEKEKGLFKNLRTGPRVAAVNLHEARRWYLIAARPGELHGDAADNDARRGALNNLGVMWWFGEGGAQDQIEAYKCWRLAAGENSTAKSNMDYAQEFLKPEQLTEAKRRAEAWASSTNVVLTRR